MKKTLLVLSVAFSMSSFAQVSDATLMTTALPTATVIRMTDVGLASLGATTLAPSVSTLASVADARGVAGKEQLKDDLVALSDDMASGAVKSIAEVRQPALREFMEEVSEDEEQMAAIDSSIEGGSELEKLATALSVVLLAQ